MTITFRPTLAKTDMSLLDVYLGPIQHGVIEQGEGGRFCYYRSFGNSSEPRHSSHSLEKLKRKIRDIP